MNNNYTKLYTERDDLTQDLDEIKKIIESNEEDCLNIEANNECFIAQDTGYSEEELNSNSRDIENQLESLKDREYTLNNRIYEINEELCDLEIGDIKILDPQ